MRRIRKMLIPFISGILLFLLIGICLGSVPSVISYQGRLLNESGRPVADGTCSMTFSLFTQSTGGTAVWSESQEVPVKNGIFTVLLGSVNPLQSDLFQGNSWLETVVNGSLLTPRTQMASTAYAMRAKTSDTVPDGSVTSTTLANSSVTNQKIANNSVSSAKLANGVVTTIKLADANVTFAKLNSDVPTSINARNGMINVKDYGAKGDGITDDTLAIRNAAAAAGPTVCKQSSIGLYYIVGPALVFPAGEYMISDEILLPPHILEICGEGQAVINQKDITKNIFKNTYCWQQTIRNLTFIGGKNQIDLYNPNIDTGQIIIDHCRFILSEGFAVKTDVLSTTVQINNCQFNECYQAWYNGRSDQAVMAHCWITTSSKMDNKAAIEHRGMRLTIEDLCGVTLTGGTKRRWIDVYGFDGIDIPGQSHPSANLSLKHCRMGGEGGGFTVVYNYAKYVSTNPNPLASTIVIDDCFLPANSTTDARCVVYCYQVPNQIRIQNSVLPGPTGVIVDSSINLSNYFTNIPAGLLSYTVENCVGESIGQLPAGLRTPIIN